MNKNVDIQVNSIELCCPELIQLLRVNDQDMLKNSETRVTYTVSNSMKNLFRHFPIRISISSKPELETE